MNIKEIIAPVIGIVVLLVFMIFMFDYYDKRQQKVLLIKNLYYDSLIIKNQKDLKIKDSIIVAEQELIKSMLKRQSNQIIELKKETNNIYKNKIN